MSLVPVEHTAHAVAAFSELADRICKTEFVPQEFRNRPEAILACMCYGSELGLGPMQSLNMTQSIKGRVGLKPEAMRALVGQAGHRIWPGELSDGAVTMCGLRKGEPESAVVKVRWTLDDARRAQLDKGDNWRKYPRAMLVARATAELCRIHFADVIGGLSYTPEELEQFDDPPLHPNQQARPPQEDVPAIESPRRPSGVDENGEVVAVPPAATTRRPPPNRRVVEAHSEPVAEPAAGTEPAAADGREGVRAEIVEYARKLKLTKPQMTAVVTDIAFGSTDFDTLTLDQLGYVYKALTEIESGQRRLVKTAAGWDVQPGGEAA